MSTDTTVCAVLCDLGGVLITQRPDPREVLSVLGLSVEEHHIDLVDRAIWAHRDAYDDGCSDREFWDCIAGDCGLGELTDQQVQVLVEQDAGRMKHPDEEALNLIAELREAGYPVGILANSPSALADVVRRSPWAQHCNGPLIFSSDIRVSKPHRAIYREALVQVGYPAENVLFIEDRQPNLRAAELVGMQTLAWIDATEARHELLQRGILTH